MPVHMLMLACAAALAVYIYFQDRHEKEPLWAALLAIASGFAVMWLLGLADDFAIRSIGFSSRDVLSKCATIALIEEGGKLFTVYFLALLVLRTQFNDPMDGLIYGCFAGLGMAVEESLLYLSLSPPDIQTLGIEVVRLFAHSIMGGLVGFAIGLGSGPDGKHVHYPRLVILCLALSTTMHFGWNVVATTKPAGAAGHLLPMGLMLLMMLVWRLFCGIAQSRSRQLLGTPA